MISITYASGDYRDVVFPLVADDSALTESKALKKARLYKKADYAILWVNGESTIRDLIRLKNETI
jgi:hypothetical protein